MRCDFCDGGGVGPTLPVQDRDGDENKDTNNNGVPDKPDPNTIIPEMGGLCQYSTLIECLYSGGYWPSGDYTFSDEEWNQFTLALYYDVYRRARQGDGFWTMKYDPTGRSNIEGELFVPFHTGSYYHREKYDTPFWNNFETYSGNICFENGKCYNRNDVNYVAQGMWSGAALEGDVGAVIVSKRVF